MSATTSSMGPPVQSERRKGLPVTVVMLRRDGQRLTSGEFHAAPRLRGEFILRPTSRHQTGGGASHMAELIVAGALHFTPLGLPLFNPTIELADHRGFVVSGYEIHSAGGKLAHVEQAWLVTPHGGV